MELTAAAAWTDLLAGEELAYLTTEPSRAAITAPLPDDLHPAVTAALAAQGIEELYAHQADAWDAAACGVWGGTGDGTSMVRFKSAGAASARTSANSGPWLPS